MNEKKIARFTRDLNSVNVARLFTPELNVQLDEGAYMPVRAHDTDAGADLRTPKGFTLPPHGQMKIDTGVHIELPPFTYAKVESKSGLNIRASVLAPGGVVDEGYTGSLVVKLYNLGKNYHYFDVGDKIAQLVIQPVLYPTFTLVDRVEGGDRGSDGFGSSGR